MYHKTSIIMLVAALCVVVGLATAQTPSVLYETAIPGYNLPHAHDVAVNAAGEAFVIAAAYADGVHLDVLVVKLDASGNELWSRYIQGSDHDYAEGLALDSSGDVWVTGWTGSPDFPTVSAMDDTLTGFVDVFLMKLASSDGSILYSTFIGGDYADRGYDIAIDDDDEIYLTGVAGSTDFPTTPDAYQGGPSFPMYFYQDAFIMKLAPGGNSILYSTYFGGTTDDWGDRIALDGNDNIIVAGRTDATDFPLADPYDATQRGLFVSKLSADGGTLLFSTYFGGSGNADRLADIASDTDGNVYLAGSTRSVDFPTTAGAFQETFVGAIDGCDVAFGGTFNCEDFFVSKLSTAGAGLLWSTFLGGTTVDQPRGLAIDGAGNAYVAGYTNSTDFPLAESEFSAEIVVCMLANNGSTLNYTHSIGSGSANRGNGIAVGGDGAVYFSGTVGVPADIYVSKLHGTQNTATGAGTPPNVLSLGRNYPNPFNPTTNITYSIPGGPASRVELSIFDVRGRLIKRLVDAPREPGSHTVTWRGRDERGHEVSTGVYFYRLRWGGQGISRRMVLLK